MADEQFTHFLAPNGIECLLCGLLISFQDAMSDSQGPGAWRGYAQELRLASEPVPRQPQALVRPAICSMSFQMEPRVVHSACWKIVEGLWGKSQFTIAELDGFLDCASDVAPFLPRVPYTVSPSEIDTDLGEPRPRRTGPAEPTAPSMDLNISLEEEGLKRPALSDIQDQYLPPDLDSYVPRWITTSAKDDSGLSASQTYWASVARMLQYYHPFSDLAPAEASIKITQAIRNMYDGGLESVPHLANYDVVRTNALTILLTLLRIPVEDILGAGPQGGKRAKLQTSRDIKLPPQHAPVRVIMKLATLRRPYYTEGNDRGLKVGMKYMRKIAFHADASEKVDGDVTFEVHSFGGIRLIRDKVGVIGILARQGPTWHNYWQQDPSIVLQEVVMKISSTVVECQPGAMGGSFLIAAGTYLDTHVFDQSASYLQSSGM